LGSTLRLIAESEDELTESERWLTRAIHANETLENEIRLNMVTTIIDTSPQSLYDNQRIVAEKRAADNAGQRLLLLLCQSHRCHQADEILSRLGYKYRLSECVLNYPTSLSLNNSNAQLLKSAVAASPSTYLNNPHIPQIAVVDNILPEVMLHQMQQVFAPNSLFWKAHHYDALQSLSRTVGYFSYVYPFKERKAMIIEEQVTDWVMQIAIEQGFDMSSANYAEWWVHSRVHASGHQMHYDSDEKHIARGGKPRHPIFTVVLYLSDEGFGGPTCLTNQKLNGQRGNCAWLCPTKPNRLMLFDATYLHGVLPGVGTVGDGQRRVSFMIGFWSSLSSILTGEKPGAAHCFPPDDTSFIQHTNLPLSSTTTASGTANTITNPTI
jgi:hypothetical protein